ncbi:hypothetical protein [Streptosporangium sp. KLBMP 9127]|nr:hypothetical protein [Streptosporangium sp. KLBMP 9127]
MAASSPVAACGVGSYHVIDKKDLGKAVVYLMYNGTTNCVVTWKDTTDDVNVGAYIRPAGGTSRTEYDDYKYYAGPVKVNAPGQCISWGGVYGGDTSSTNLWYISPMEHCD